MIQLQFYLDASDKIEGIAFEGMHHFRSSKNYDLNLRLLQKLTQSQAAPTKSITKSYTSSNFTNMIPEQTFASIHSGSFIPKTPASRSYQTDYCYYFCYKKNNK